MSRVVYGSGIATLTVGCCLKGVFEIYGTASPFVIYYFIIGFILSAIGILIFIHNAFLS